MEDAVNRMLMKVSACLYGAFIVWIIVRSDTGGCGTVCAPAGWFPLGDKAGHVGLLAMLALLSNLAVGTARGRFGISKISALLLIAISIEECSQVMFPGRTPDVLDQLANCCGIYVGDLVSRVIARRPGLGSVTAEDSMNYVSGRS